MSRHWNPAKSVLDNGVDGLHITDLSLDSIVTSSRYIGHGTEPLVPPIQISSTYKIKSVDEYIRILQEGGYIYSRLGHMNSDAVEAAINAIEQGAGTLVFSAGMSAFSAAMFGLLKAGDHVVACYPCYSAAFDLFDKIMTKFGVEVSWVHSGCSVEEYRTSVKENTRLLYGETPCNPTMAILDLEEFGKLGKSLGDNVLTMVDGTFASPYLQQAMKYGIDISFNSCTKYLGGHSDLTAGSLTFSTVSLWKHMKRYQTSLGLQLSPHDASLLLRGIKTLHVRMERHSSNAMKVAEFLEHHPKVKKVMYPGLKSHPQHEIAKKQMRSFSGMISVEIKGGIEGGKALVENVRLIQLAVSLGGVESLIEHPATMTHGPMIMSDEERKKGHITDGLVRISIGLEDPDDLIKDLAQALENVQVEQE
ncbi:hypothetical protein ACJMK2_010814 [Sinanodonta woodiana]|uniref:cystathionine gamma-lyase n=1 Tax=Sinanodonta woodiana TaxID=1069815 RepID=A0ABD3VGL8_SINWO